MDALFRSVKTLLSLLSASLDNITRGKERKVTQMVHSDCTVMVANPHSLERRIGIPVERKANLLTTKQIQGLHGCMNNTHRCIDAFCKKDSRASSDRMHTLNTLG